MVVRCARVGLCLMSWECWGRLARVGWCWSVLMSHVGASWAVRGGGRPCLAGPASCAKNGKRRRGKERPVGPGSASSWVSAHYQIGIRKILFFFKSFYNLQTNLNSI
jgi:hypothetical protein